MTSSISIQNLKCGGCAATITNRLSKIEHISDVQVDEEESKVIFNHEDEHQRTLVEQRLKDLGYPPVDDENSLMSKAKSFVSCATGRISKL
ncbi:heavy-metal-associated domain-containing protein [Allomuricauda sp. SCSIO 65647]|uniref:heavy-metal-associated domain-containing protein n=1 Tax=Allomuricauda sp. SCSIO 65647 TaxID=2908843 RepID=UPI001F46E3FB|nr:heavy metal-associated domain-containing protein [Muricauda sp. SCSIO 65647]UJH68764.1 heavy-metal-associated domain-containing protein [Muricauda sp. SCSIO 65647]